MCKFEEEYIMIEPYKDHLYKLYLERNDQTLNSFNAIIMLALLANMDLQPILTYEGLIGYCTKYLTKYDRPDLFKCFRDDTGKPTDAGANISRNEITVQQQVTKWFNEHTKYAMLSSPELLHHLLKLPTHFKSRSFLTITLLSDQKKLLQPTEIDKPDQNMGDNQPILVKEDMISIYEKRCTFKIPKSSEDHGITKESLANIEFIFVSQNILCKKWNSMQETKTSHNYIQALYTS